MRPLFASELLRTAFLAAVPLGALAAGAYWRIIVPQRYRRTRHVEPTSDSESTVDPTSERPRSRYDFCTYESRFAFALGSITATLMSRTGKPVLRGPVAERDHPVAT